MGYPSICLVSSPRSFLGGGILMALSLVLSKVLSEEGTSILSLVLLGVRTGAVPGQDSGTATQDSDTLPLDKRASSCCEWAVHLSWSHKRPFLCSTEIWMYDLDSIQDSNIIVSSEISLEMESFKMCKESLISMEIETFDRLRSGLNSFYGELLLIESPYKR